MVKNTSSKWTKIYQRAMHLGYLYKLELSSGSKFKLKSCFALNGASNSVLVYVRDQSIGFGRGFFQVIAACTI